MKFSCDYRSTNTLMNLLKRRISKETRRIFQKFTVTFCNWLCHVNVIKFCDSLFDSTEQKSSQTGI